MFNIKKHIFADLPCQIGQSSAPKGQVETLNCQMVPE